VARRKKISPSAEKRVSAKIAKLVREGRPVKQAAAIAYRYQRAGRLGPRGGLLPKKGKRRK